MTDSGFPLPGGNHALLIGEVVGTLLKAGHNARPEVVRGHYTNRILIQRPSGVWYLTVDPGPGANLE